MAPQLLTYEDYAALPDDGKRYELIDGALVELSAPSLRHQRLQVRLGGDLIAYLRTNPIGEVLFAPFDVTLSVHNTFQPDLLYVANEHADRFDPKRLMGAPTLAIEIASPSTAWRDIIIKRERYRDAGVVEFWEVYGDSNHVESYTGDFIRPRVIEAPEPISTPVLPGLEIDLTALFA